MNRKTNVIHLQMAIFCKIALFLINISVIKSEIKKESIRICDGSITSLSCYVRKIWKSRGLRDKNLQEKWNDISIFGKF